MKHYTQINQIIIAILTKKQTEVSDPSCTEEKKYVKQKKIPIKYTFKAFML